MGRVPRAEELRCVSWAGRTYHLRRPLRIFLKYRDGLYHYRCRAPDVVAANVIRSRAWSRLMHLLAQEIESGKPLSAAVVRVERARKSNGKVCKGTGG